MAQLYGAEGNAEMGSEVFDHATSLVSIGCDEVQGYYVAPPMQARDLEHRLAQLTPG